MKKINYILLIFLFVFSTTSQANNKVLKEKYANEESLLIINLSQKNKKIFENSKITNENWEGAQYWYKKGKLHRDNDLPAVTFPDGTKMWLIEGMLHRENDKPAVIWSDGTKEWRINGVLHRENNPAIINFDGKEYWFKNGEIM